MLNLTQEDPSSTPPPATSTKVQVDTNDKPLSSLSDAIHILRVTDSLSHSQLSFTTIDSESILAASTIQSQEIDAPNTNSAQTMAALEEKADLTVSEMGLDQDAEGVLASDEYEHIDNNNEPIQETAVLEYHEPHQESQEQHGPHHLMIPIIETPVNLLRPTISPKHTYLSSEDDEDEGERGTVLILTPGRHQDFGRRSMESILTVSSTEASITCDTVYVQKAEDPARPRSEGDSSPNIPVPSGDEASTSVAQSDFILQPSGFEPYDNVVVTIPELHSPTSSSSAVSLSADSSPAAQTHRPRPSSQQPLPASFAQCPLTSTQNSLLAMEEDELQFKHLRRSRSLPSSPQSFGSFEVVSLSAFDSPLVAGNRYSEYVSAPKLEHELPCDWLPSQHSPTCPLHYGPDKEGEILTREDMREEPDSLLSESVTSQPQLPIAPGERYRRQSLLSPRQLQRLSQQQDMFQPRAKETTGPLWKTRLGYLGKDHHKKNSRRPKGSLVQEKGKEINDPDSMLPSGQKSSQSSQSSGPSVPSITFQLHQTEFSTERPSVSGRLILHIPRRSGKKFHFVSLALHLRLKESIAWTRHDLFSFEVESHHWAQTVWDKKMMIPFQERQVEEGEAGAFGSMMTKGISPAAAIAAAASAPPPGSKSAVPVTSTLYRNDVDTSDIPHIQPATPQLDPSALGDAQGNQYSPSTCSRTDAPATQAITMDEWRWEWFLPVTRNEVRPESFEGSMGMVWYELEAKCLFRWDDVDVHGNVVPNGSATMTAKASATHAKTTNTENCRLRMAKNHSGSGSRKLLKGFGASTKKAKSIAQAFGKFRVGSKPKSTTGVGDFNIPSLHEQYIQNSIRKTQEAAEAAAAVKAAEAAKAAETQLENNFTLTQGEWAQDNARHDQQSDNTGGSGCSSDGSTRSADQIPEAFETPPSVALSTAHLSSIPEAIPFLARRTLKLYFSRPPPKISSNPAFFLPQPLMSLPTLPSTRRLKAIIPGARIQVQIQVPSIIPIPGYVQLLQLVPSNKTGGLAPVKGSSNTFASTASNIFGDKFASGHSRRNSKDHHHQHDDWYPRSFQAALTIRKVTQQDINKNESLRRRYQFAESTTAPVRRFSTAPDTSVTPHCATTKMNPQGSSRARGMSFQSDMNVGSSSRSVEEEHGSDDMVEMVEVFPCTDEGLGDKDRQQVVAEAPDPLKPTQGKGWRKEIRVRKVKCEFWQKESCRIPTDEAPSRSAKIQLAPAFSYSEKEREKERQRQAAVQQQSVASLEPITLDPPVDFHPQPLYQSRLVESNTQDEGSSGPLSSFLKGGCRSSAHTFGHGPTESLKPWINRKGSTGSISHSSLQQPVPDASPLRLTPAQTQSNQPFMLLVPVPLDNPRLRQTFSWPSSETPSPIAPSAYDYPFARNAGVESSVGFGSELDYPSQPTLNEIMGTSIRGGGPIASAIPSGPPAKARIEVKHYLSFRLSLDMLEYEGELEQDDIDLEAIEEQQLKELRDRQNPSLAFDQSIAGEAFSASGAPGPLTAMIATVQHYDNEGSPPSQVSSTNANIPLHTGSGPECRTLPGSEHYGVVYERCSSKTSLGAVQSATSGNSVSNIGAGGGTLSALSQIHASSALSGGSNISDRAPQTSSSNSGRSAGLVAGAIGALKKKASAVGLGNIIAVSSTSTSGQQQQHHSADQPSGAIQHRVTVQKLKDFVIRVPITIVIQIDDRGKATNTFGTIDNPSINSAIPTEASRSDDPLSNLRPVNNAPISSASQFTGSVNITTTETTTVKNIITGSSANPRRSIDPLESTDTFGSLASVAASAGSEPLRKRMDDFATGSSSLAFAGMKRRQDQACPETHPPSHLLLQQQQQQQLHHSSSRYHGPSLLPLTHEGLQQHMHATNSQQ